ncbi:MAG: CHASE2 domain-containing protein [Hyphomicrobiaceae bacterium]
MSTRWLSFVPAVVVLMAAIVLRLVDPTPIANLRLSVFDTYLRAAPRQADPEYPVRVVAIDEASLKELGQWPWPRTVLAKLIERLNGAGAKSITLDIIMPEGDRLSPIAFATTLPDTAEFQTLKTTAATLPTNDAVLAKAIKSTSTVILGLAGDASSSGPLPPARAGFATAGDDPRHFLPAFPASISSLPELNANAEGLGATNWLPERDQVVRRVPLLVTIEGKIYPSLALETFRIASGASTIFVKSSGGSGRSAFGQKSGIETLRVGETLLPVNAKGELWLRLSQTDPLRTLSAHEVLSDSFDPTTVAGHNIFIGASAVGLFDLRATALSDSMPGVEIHAQAMEQMLSGDHAYRPAFATGYELLFLIAIGLAIAGLIVKIGPTVAAGAGIAAIAAVSYGSWLAYKNSGLLFDPVYPSIALLALYLTGSLARYIISEQERAQVRTAFSSYVAPALVEELADNPDKLKLGGETRELTLLFADVRQFSAISEGMSAEDLIRFVNRLFEPLSDIILEERGTIDKFMGDAVMAFWNAPLTDPDHAAHACQAALKMQKKLNDLNTKWAAESADMGTSFQPVGIGIGINTGPCCVGNMGSSQRFDYSVIGDVVNVASRLEAETKAFSTPIIVGEKTTSAAPGFAYLPLDKITPRGKTLAQQVYALVGDCDVANTANFKALLADHEKLVEALADNNTKAAKEFLKKCKTHKGFGYDRLLVHYEKTVEDINSA